MADRKPTVLNPAGYQENLQDTDNLVAAAMPTEDNHVVNRGYLKLVQDEIDGDIDLAGRWTLDGVSLFPRGDDQNVYIGGTLPSSPNIELNADGTGVFTGNLTALSFTGPLLGDVTGDVTGNLTGNVEGNVTGDLTGDVTGNLNGDVTGNLTGNVTGDVTGNLNGNVTGDVTGDVTGNADSASKLETARNINGTAFDGTADITTEKWGTARNLNGVSVDGSADKTLEPYVERDDSTNTARWLTFVDNNTAGYKRLNMDTSLTYNPGTNILNVNISGDANSIDGLDSSKFLRSDVDDSAAGDLTFNGRTNIRGHLDISDSQNVDFGSSDDVRINYNGSNNWLYCDFRTGAGIIFQDNGSNKIVLEDSGIFRPGANNAGSLGSSSVRWANGYFTNVDASSIVKGTSKVQAGNDGGGAAALTINDGAGNCNLTFNHANNSADQDGNAFRISGNTDTTTSATLTFSVYENITQGTAGTGVNPLKLTKNGAEVTGTIKATHFDLESLPPLP